MSFSSLRWLQVGRNADSLVVQAGDAEAAFLQESWPSLGTSPSLLLLRRKARTQVRHLSVIEEAFLQPDTSSLSPSAGITHRPGWRNR